MEKQGRIIKGIAGQYEVMSELEKHICLARGRFRKDGVTPMVGDEVLFSPETAQEKGYILRIMPRRNELKRPPVSNMDHLLIVMAVTHPEPDLMLCDRLLVQASMMEIEPILCLNKCDLADPVRVAALKDQYRHLPIVLDVSTKSGLHLDEMREALSRGTTCLAGQSGVGKSSLINHLIPANLQETGDMSLKIQRGKHTTRSVSLLPVAADAFVLDTPGFSVLEMEDGMDPVLLQDHYPDFQPWKSECRFHGCVHHKEPDCAVQKAAERGDIHPLRYERYILILQELMQLWRNRYD